MSVRHGLFDGNSGQPLIEAPDVEMGVRVGVGVGVGRGDDVARVVAGALVVGRAVVLAGVGFTRDVDALVEAVVVAAVEAAEVVPVAAVTGSGLAALR